MRVSTSLFLMGLYALGCGGRANLRVIVPTEILEESKGENDKAEETKISSVWKVVGVRDEKGNSWGKPLAQTVSFSGNWPPNIRPQETYFKRFLIGKDEEIKFTVVIEHQEKAPRNRYQLSVVLSRNDQLVIDNAVLYLFAGYLEPFCDWRYLTTIYSGNASQLTAVMRPVSLDKDKERSNKDWVERSCVIRLPKNK